MEEFLNQTDDSENIMCFDALAWKLLMDDDVENYAGILLPFVMEEDNNNTSKISTNKGMGKDKLSNVRYDSLADQFQILISVYMEMVFGMLKINHVNSLINDNGDIDESIDLEATFKPDLSLFTMDGLTDTFRDKFKKIRVFLSVLGIYDAKEGLKDYGSGNQRFSEALFSKDNNGSSSDYYCRIILKDSAEGKTYFKANAHWLDPEKRYTFVMRNDNEKKQAKLADFYAVCKLPDMKVRISFSQINVITQNQHTV